MVKSTAGSGEKGQDQTDPSHEKVCQQIKTLGLDYMRFSFADQHGILRGKTVAADQSAAVLKNGCSMTSTLLAKDTSHKTVFPVWQAPTSTLEQLVAGAGDILMVPILSTFTQLPWLEKTGWMLCDLHTRDAKEISVSPRTQLKKATARLAERGMKHLCGLEVEFHVFRVEEAFNQPENAASPGHPARPPEVSYLSRGSQYLTDNSADMLEPVMDMLARACRQMGLPLRSMECEFGPSQMEFTFHPQEALKAADNMMLFRSMVKQLCQRQGLHATFMSKPKLDNIMSSGWHLHQSLVDIATEQNLFTPQNQGVTLSATGRHFVAGLLTHAKASCAFACPTINAYKRFQPFMLAPQQIVWANDNKGAMIRVIGSANDPASRVENRIGEPAANPYLYFASQIYAGLDGIDRKLDCGEPVETPYAAGTEKLPDSLENALADLDRNTVLRTAMGDEFIDYFLHIKRAEIDRFKQTVTDWEQREYFGNF